MRLSTHSKRRIVERDSLTSSVAEAKKVAKIAYNAGKSIGAFCGYPKFFEYLQKKKEQTCNCQIRVYRDNIYIWKGSKHTLVTAHPIPDRFRSELKGEK